MVKHDSIIDGCTRLNEQIHGDIYLNNFLSEEPTYNKAFTSLDLIEDTQGAVEEYLQIPDERFSRRSTLYIYGVLQALYCQQDGIQHFYEAMHGRRFKKFGDFLNEVGGWPDVSQIRDIRNDIAGHPTSRKGGSEFYFTAKGANSKFVFEYGGYTPSFRGQSVNLKPFIEVQQKFALSVLAICENKIENDIKEHKRKYAGKSLAAMFKTTDHQFLMLETNLIAGRDSFDGANTSILKCLAQIETAIRERFAGTMNDSVEYAVTEIKRCLSNLRPIKGMELDESKVTFASDFIELTNHVNDLRDMLGEIDEEFSV